MGSDVGDAVQQLDKKAVLEIILENRLFLIL